MQPTEEPVGSGQCPFARVQQLDDLTALLRSRTAVEQSPALFAAVAEDPVNGEIQVHEFLDGSTMFANGDSHRDRRKQLNRLVREESLRVIRDDVVLPAADRVMQRLLRKSGDGQYRMDIVQFCEQVFINFTAKLIGLIDVDSEERAATLSSLTGPIVGGGGAAWFEDRAAAIKRGLAAKEQYIEEFYRPSKRWYEDMMARVQAGEIADDQVPDSLMKLIVRGAHPRWLEDDTAIIESTTLFGASVGTSTQSIVHTVDLLNDWFTQHPEDYDRRSDHEFLLSALQETLRLRAPFAPYTTRYSRETHVLSDGTTVSEGQELHLEFVVANRDPAIFGDDANEFNPRRNNPANGLPRYGVAFGVGEHQCFGLRVVVGADGNGGAHLSLLQKLMAAGARPDPTDPPVETKNDMSKFPNGNIPRYTRYPAVFPQWTEAEQPIGSV